MRFPKGDTGETACYATYVTPLAIEDHNLQDGNPTEAITSLLYLEKGYMAVSIGTGTVYRATRFM